MDYKGVLQKSSFLALVSFLILILGGIVVAQDNYQEFVEISGSGDPDVQGEDVELEVDIYPKTRIEKVTANIIPESLAQELTLIQESSTTVSEIREDESRTLQVPIGTSDETPVGEYRVDYFVTFTHEGTEYKTEDRTAYVEVKDSSCFIATAVSESETHEMLKPLRNFRDSVLKTNPITEGLVNAYYSSSPPIAESMKNNNLTRNAAKYTLVLPASLSATIILNPTSLAIIIGLIIASGFLLFKFEKESLILKTLPIFAITLIIGITFVLTLGTLNNLWTGFSQIASYLIPFLIPLSLLTPIIFYKFQKTKK